MNGKGPHHHNPRQHNPRPGGPGGGFGPASGAPRPRDHAMHGRSGSGSAGGSNDEDVAALLRAPVEKEQYFSDNGRTIRVELLDTEAQAIAEKLKELPNTQLRRFYDPVVALRLRAQAGKLDAEQVKAELAMMKARAAYAYKRPGQKVPAELVKFFTKHAASVDTPEKLIAFARHFEAIVAYHRIHNPN